MESADPRLFSATTKYLLDPLSHFFCSAVSKRNGSNFFRADVFFGDQVRYFVSDDTGLSAPCAGQDQ